ncbi:MAG: penicillin-binding protein activator LpoB [Candidatus Omnitrophica bacterium]|nr:penicillin-binding protein activator LpoB [Candidatus Omnitrophota bacterium]
MKNMFSVFAVCALAVLFAGCSTTTVKRVEVDEQIDLSGKWNDTDSQLVSAEMIDDCTHQRWVGDFKSENGRVPVVIVGVIKNRSHEHINTMVFIKDLERQLLNSGRVKFVASKDERGQVRAEREDQQKGYTDPATIKKIGKETGADFILIGSINTIKDETKGRYVILYQTNLELIDIETNQKVWIGQKYLKKVVKKSKYSL